MFLRILFVIICALLIISGCSYTKPYIKQNTVSHQQAEADKAFNELDQETGEPQIKEPIFEKDVDKPVLDKPSIIEEKKAPSNVKDKKQSNDTKFPLKDGRPVWFYDANYDGYFGAIGIARKSSVRGGYAAQKRLAKTLAQAELAKQLKVFVSTELKIERTRILSKLSDTYTSKLSSLSVHKSEEILQNAVILDEWVDPNNGDLYVWLVIEK
ncbi:LPP20 family lipoprotein [Deferribacteraceae bacterium V6Fe1]|nr:LPP20 family lipoprotein [Deferribacteraceae bacterium V6Fe1]